MKGTLFQKPLEFNLEVHGETWNQGSEIQGTLEVTNHGADNVDLSSYGVALALGNMRKVKAKDAEAFAIEQASNFATSELAPGAKSKLEFRYSLPLNGPISDKTQSPYLVYGNLENRDGNLKLAVEPSLTFKPLLDVLDVFFRFKIKERKSAKTTVDFKLVTPDAKEFKALDSLVLKMKELPEQGIDLKFQFQMKNIGVSAGTVEVKKSKDERTLKLSAKDYLFQKNAPNQDAIRKLLQGVFDEVLPKQFF